MNLHHELGRFDINFETGEVYWSPEFAEIVGLPGSYAADFDEFLKCVQPDDRRAMTAIRNNLLAAAPSVADSLELRIWGTDGKTRWIRVMSRSFGHDTMFGPTACVLGFVTEVIHDDAAPAQGGQHSMMGGAGGVNMPIIGAFDVNIQTGVEYWTPELAAIFGLTPEVSGFEVVFKHVHPEDRPAVISAFSVVTRPESPRVALRHRIIREDGEERSVQMAGRTIFDTESQQAVCFVGIVADVTDDEEHSEGLCAR